MNNLGLYICLFVCLFPYLLSPLFTLLGDGKKRKLLGQTSLRAKTESSPFILMPKGSL